MNKDLRKATPAELKELAALAATFAKELASLGTTEAYALSIINISLGAGLERGHTSLILESLIVLVAKMAAAEGQPINNADLERDYSSVNASSIHNRVNNLADTLGATPDPSDDNWPEEIGE